MDFNAFLKSLIELGQDKVSDIHFKVGSAPLLRINNVLQPAKFNPLTKADTKKIVSFLVDEEDRERIDEIRAYDTSYTIPDYRRFRVNIFRQRGAFSVVLRVVPSRIRTFEELNLPGVVKTICEEERGMVLVTGLKGSGKSTTLASMIDHLNGTRNLNIITIEDPIEYVHVDNLSSINQREVGHDTESFPAALSEALRQDPDVILVSELKDAETISTAVRAAETGFLVLSGLNTVDVPQTLERLVESFPAEEEKHVRMQLAANLMAIVSQRLLPTKDVKTMIPAVEVLRTTSTIKDCIQDPGKGERIREILEQDSEIHGTLSFDQHLRKLYEEGKITLDTAVSASTSPSDFRRALTIE